MYIPEFWCGVGTMLLLEFAVSIALAVFSRRKKEMGERRRKEGGEEKH